MDTNSQNKKVLVTGASGQDGSYMIDFLLAHTDCEVIGAIRRTSQLIDSHFKQHLRNPRFKIIHLDLSDPHSITNTIKNEKPDYFINFGAQTFVADSWQSPATHFQTNALAVIHILEAIKNYQPLCRFYNAGSSEEFGDVTYSPQDENHPMRPRSPYGASKVAARCITKVYRESYGLYAIQGFLFNHESERRQDYFVTRKITKAVARIKKAIDREEAYELLELGNLDSRRDWSDAECFVDGVWKMLNHTSPQEYVLSSNETHTIREFVELAFESAGINGEWYGEGLHEEFRQKETGRVLMVINEKFYRPAEVDLLLGDSTKARQELGWKPKTSFKNLIDKMVKNDILLLDGKE
jgi:GDPmannose 4,6-dehydratase